MRSNDRITMAEIAKRSGVSLSTVSLVLRNRAGVGTDTRQRVLDVAKDLGYIPKIPVSPYLSNLTNIGLILKAEPDRVPRANQFYSHVLAGIEMACRKRQMNLLYATMTVDQDSYPLELPRILAEGDAADGLLLVGAFLNEALAHVIERHSMPAVLVDAYAISDRYDAVVSDNFKGAYQAISHLVEHGHRHIGLVGGHPKAYPSLRERQGGYMQALEDHGISDHYLAECHVIDAREILEATTDLLRSNPQITAIFGVNDETALAVMEVAQDLGRQVPGDLSVIGFDDIDLASCVTPSLTTMQVDKVGMGRLAVHLLVNRANQPESSPVKAVVRPRLIERDSVCAI
jgi:LacI family transcriptional regulator